MSRAQPKQMPVPKGWKLGYKAVTATRYGVYQRTREYRPGSMHTAGGYRCETRAALRAYRKRVDQNSHCCLPGIHVCKTMLEADYWQDSHRGLIIPVAYSPWSVVGSKGTEIVVVYRIKVLG